MQSCRRRHWSEEQYKVTWGCCSGASFCPGDWQGHNHMKSKLFPMSSAFSPCVSWTVGWISHQVGPSKKNPSRKGRNAVVVSDWLFSSSKYVLRNARSYAGLQREGSSLHHRQGCKEGQRGEFSPNFALAPRTAFSFFLYNLVWETVYMGSELIQERTFLYVTLLFA